MHKINTLRLELQLELVNNILPYWTNNMIDNEQGGFYGRITGNNELISKASKGAILNARILWTFSSACRLLNDPDYLMIATRAKEYILKYYFDNIYGGTYWSLNNNGIAVDSKKQIYSLAFFIYALAEYNRTTGDTECLAKAIELFHLIEKYSFDPVNNGYFEAYSRDWKLLDDLRLSDKDANEKKTMNTHLHLLEAYTNLYKVWKDKELSSKIKNLIILFLDKIVDANTHHLNLFFDEKWNRKSDFISYGHDIEASWLIDEASHILGDKNLIERTEIIILKMAEVSTQGIQSDGSLIYEKNLITSHTDNERHWWVQAEAIVGYMNAFQITKNRNYLTRVIDCWHYIKLNLVDVKKGEWYWSIRDDGTINREEDKAGFWKCPYHNSRACMEILRRT